MTMTIICYPGQKNLALQYRTKLFKLVWKTTEPYAICPVGFSLVNLWDGCRAIHIYLPLFSSVMNTVVHISQPSIRVIRREGSIVLHL